MKTTFAPKIDAKHSLRWAVMTQGAMPLLIRNKKNLIFADDENK